MKKYARILIIAGLLSVFALTGCIRHTGSETQPPSETAAQQTEPSAAPTMPPTQAQTEAPTAPPTEPPTEKPTEPPTQPPTEKPTAPPTEKPTEAPTQPPTEKPTEPPTQPPEEYIGQLYTRSQLEAMENENKGYGPGTTSGGARPPYAVSDQKKYGQYAGNFIAPDNGNIYLTFDCGYEYFITDESGKKVALTGRILDTLKEKNVKAVFFVTMSYCKNNPGLVRRMIAEGHVVGNHSNHHYVMPTLTIDEMMEEIMSLHRYVQTEFGYTMTLFRPPTGAFSTRSLAVAQTLGYKNVHWSFAYRDWETDDQPDLEEARSHVIGSAHSGAIYLLHAVSETNTLLLGDAIDAFRTAGYHLELFR